MVSCSDISKRKCVENLAAFWLRKIINILSNLCHAVAVGDEESDPTLMEFLGAEMKKESGQFFKVDQHDKEEKGHFSGLGNPSAASPGAWQAGGEGIQGGLVVKVGQISY